MANTNCSFWLSPKGMASLGLIGAASYFLLVEHQQHLAQWLPFLIIAICPLMHIFMHKGHSGHGSHDHQNAYKSEETEDEAYRRGLEEGKKQSGNHQHRGK
jgi:hypothetical protein